MSRHSESSFLQKLSLPFLVLPALLFQSGSVLTGDTDLGSQNPQSDQTEDGFLATVSNGTGGDGGLKGQVWRDVGAEETRPQGWQDVRSGFRVCESLRSRQGLVSKAQQLDEAFASKDSHLKKKKKQKPDKNVTVSSMAGQVVYEKGGLEIPLKLGKQILTELAIGSCDFAFTPRSCKTQLFSSPNSSHFCLIASFLKP